MALLLKRADSFPKRGSKTCRYSELLLTCPEIVGSRSTKTLLGIYLSMRQRRRLWKRAAVISNVKSDARTSDHATEEVTMSANLAFAISHRRTRFILVNDR